MSWRSLPNKCLPRLESTGDFFAEADSRKGESPLDHDDDAMDALRYLVASIDERKLGRRRWFGGGAAGETPKERKWLSLYNEALWTPVWRVWR